MTSRVNLSNATSRGVVLDMVRTRGPISQSRLAKLTGLTQATMSKVLRQLAESGLIIESGRAGSTGGRPTVLFDLNPESRFAVGIEVSADHVTSVAVNLGGSIVARIRSRAANDQDADGIAGHIVRQVRSMLQEDDLDAGQVVGVGVVAPGPVDLVNGVFLPGRRPGPWRGTRLREALQAELGLPVVLDNDANAAALGDFWGGEVPEFGTHATIYMSAGMGTGILIDGTAFRGTSSNAGEIGQIVLERDADGSARTVQQLAAPAAVVARALESAPDARRLRLDAGDTFESFRAIASAAIRGDEFAQSLLAGSARYLSEAALYLANLLDLDSISLAGPAFAIAGPLYVREIEQRVGAHFFARASHEINVRLSANVADAAAVGAAALVLQSEFAPRQLGLLARR